MKIELKWITDSYDCDQGGCSGGYAEGAFVKFEDGTEIDMTPQAHCYDGESYGPAEVYAAILQHLGHTLTIDGQEVDW